MNKAFKPPSPRTAWKISRGPENPWNMISRDIRQLSLLWPFNSNFMLFCERFASKSPDILDSLLDWEYIVAG